MSTLLLAVALELASNPPDAITELDESDWAARAFSALIAVSIPAFAVQIICALMMNMTASAPGTDAEILKCAMGFGLWPIELVFQRGMQGFIAGTFIFLVNPLPTIFRVVLKFCIRCRHKTRADSKESLCMC